MLIHWSGNSPDAARPPRAQGCRPRGSRCTVSSHVEISVAYSPYPVPFSQKLSPCSLADSALVLLCGPNVYQYELLQIYPAKGAAGSRVGVEVKMLILM